MMCAWGRALTRDTLLSENERNPLADTKKREGEGNLLWLHPFFQTSPISAKVANTTLKGSPKLCLLKQSNGEWGQQGCLPQSVAEGSSPIFGEVQGLCSAP